MAITAPSRAVKPQRPMAPAFDYEPYYSPLPLTPAARDLRPETALEQMFGYWAG